VCGIAGILAGEGAVPEDALRKMTGALRARGPDGEGYHIDGRIGLGHRRLAIIDVEGGKQPLFSEDGRVAAIVNGEIYNFVELRHQLEGRGHRFATRSDSEVLVHGWEEWGVSVVDRLEGMFALAIWDAGQETLLLARDRLGEKPLYWAALPRGGICFASELKSLRHAPDLPPRIDPAALARYLVYEYVPAPMSILAGVKKLEPGTLLVARPGRDPEIRRYWDLPLVADGGSRDRDPDEAAERLLAEMRRSVRERLVSDVPLGVFLSGGIDSSAVAVLAAEARGGDLDTFSIGFEPSARERAPQRWRNDEVSSFDETNEARRVARAIGSRHHEDRLSPDVLRDLLPSIGELLDEPLGDGSIAPTHLLARFARKHVTVALGGDGGDELFAGYPTFQAERVASILDRVPAPVSRAVVRAGAAAASALPVSMKYFSLDFKLKQFWKGAAAEGERRHQAWLESLAPPAALAALSPDVASQAGSDLYDVIDRRMSSCQSTDRWDRLLYFYAKGYLGDDVLTKVDRATMAVGLEARAPFLDTRVVSLACRVDPSLRLRGWETKHLLKRALRGLLPDETLGRKKQGFAMPIGRWLRDDLRPLLEDTLSESRLAASGLFSPAPIRALVDDHVRGRVDNRKPLWTLVAFMRWMETYFRN
jgi:asparagine synthase (glutamine-hydrolysing)